MMRILHVISTMAPSSGGPTSILAAMTAAQATVGIQVEVCTTDRGNPSSDLLDVRLLRSFLNSAVRLHSFPTEMSGPLLSMAMRRWLKRHITDYDLVHVHGMYRFPPTYAAWLARKRGMPYIIWPHGSLDPFLHKQSSRSVWLKRLWERWFDLPNLQAASAIHYTSEDERDRASFMRLHAPPIVVANGLDWDRFADLPAPGTFRERLGLDPQVPLILFLSRINFKKGLDLLIPAFAQVRMRHTDAILAIVGPDNEGYGAQVRDWVREHGLDNVVLFVDKLEGNAVVQAYVDADVFVLPSYSENFGLVVAESLACGTPVVISDQVNIHREVSNSGAGLVTRCDVVEIAESLSKLLSDPSLRQSAGRAGRDLVQCKWTLDVMVRDLTEEYERAIARHRARERL